MNQIVQTVILNEERFGVYYYLGICVILVKQSLTKDPDESFSVSAASSFFHVEDMFLGFEPLGFVSSVFFPKLIMAEWR